MIKLLKWLVDNKDWIFSGVGLACLGVVGKVVFNRRKNENKGSTTINQVNNGSGNTQIGIQRNYYQKHERK